MQGNLRLVAIVVATVNRKNTLGGKELVRCSEKGISYARSRKHFREGLPLFWLLF